MMPHERSDDSRPASHDGRSPEPADGDSSAAAAGAPGPAALPPVVPPMNADGRPPEAEGHDRGAPVMPRPVIRTGVTILDEPLSPEQVEVERLKIDAATRAVYDAEVRRRRRHLRTSLILFVLTFLSTTLVGADFWPLDIVSGFFNPQTEQEILVELNFRWPPAAGQTPTLMDRLWESIARGCTYSCPLMLILFCHEMGHYLQAVKNRVPASLPYFIPLPLPPLGTMGAVILQGRGAADRRKMFDIAVSGPIAGLVITMPILIYGLQTSGYQWQLFGPGFEFGQPLLVKWLIDAIHGPAPIGQVFVWNGWATAGWVGIFITAMNMLPVGQLDGGHIMYTLIGKPAHYIAWGIILVAVSAMIYSGLYSYVLLLILLTLTGPRHPPTANDAMSLGWQRHVIGWLTLSFLVIGFTPQPIMIPERRPEFDPEQILEPIQQIFDFDFDLPPGDGSQDGSADAPNSAANSAPNSVAEQPQASRADGNDAAHGHDELPTASKTSVVLTPFALRCEPESVLRHRSV